MSAWTCRFETRNSVGFMTFRQHLSHLYQTNHRVHLWIAPIRHRLVALTNFVRPRAIHQTWGTTSLNRRPALFQALVAMVPDCASLKVLSFGCSTGEEVLDLLVHYRQGRVFGTDAHRGRLAMAQARIGEAAILFRSSAANMSQHGPFDLIVACSVFIRHPEDTHTEDLGRIYPFVQFEEGLRMLYGATRPGGHILIHNSNYDVMDTSLKKGLTPVSHPAIFQNAEIPCFDRSGRKLPGVLRGPELFRVTPHTAAA